MVWKEVMMKRLNTFLAVPLAVGLLIVSGCSNGNEPSPQPTATRTGGVQPTNTAVPPATSTRTSPPANTPTNTVVQPTATNTPIVDTPTNTPVEDTATPTNTPEEGTPTNTPEEATPTNTPEEGTPTNTPEEATPTNTPGEGPLNCGDGITTPPEECDDGNNYGGDCCAANCTFETDLPLDFGNSETSLSSATVQTGLFKLSLVVTGSQVTTAGKPLSVPIIGNDGHTNFEANEIPTAAVITKNEGLLDPIQVPGLVCACIRGLELKTCGGLPIVPGDTSSICTSDPTICIDPDKPCLSVYGPGVSAGGKIGCAGLTDIDYLVVTDSISGETTFSTSGGLSDPGGTLITNNTAIGTIMDSGTCSVDTANPAKGPDGIPCTDDDPPASRGTANPTLQTTGTATANILNVNKQSGKNIDGDSSCGALPCVVSSTGAALGCADLNAGNVTGLCLASAFAALAQPSTGDIVTPSAFCAVTNSTPVPSCQ
jgi:cysteine-rich repeat protein